MGTPFIGKGTLLKLEGTTITNRVSITGPSPEIGEVDTTNLDSPNGCKENLPGWKDWKEISMTIQYDPGEVTHIALTDLITTPAVKNWTIIFSSAVAKTYSFTGWLKAFNVTGVEVSDDLVTAEITIRLTGSNNF